MVLQTFGSVAAQLRFWPARTLLSSTTMEVIVWTSIAVAFGVGITDLLRGRSRGPAAVIRYRG